MVSREQVVSAALEIVDAAGLEKLTMRRLAQKLGVDAMAAYHHIDDRAGLLDALVEAVLRDAGQSAAQIDAHTTWRERSTHIARSYRAALLRHPNAAPLMAVRPATTSFGLAVIDAWLGALVTDGFAPEQALDVITVITTYTTGQTLADAAGIASPPGQARTRLRARLDPDALPHLTLVLDRATHDRERRFELGLQAMLDGLQAKMS